MRHPRLRQDIQLVPTTVEGQRMIMFIDPLRLADNSFALDIQLLPILRLLTGTNDLRDIQMELMRQQSGRLIPLAEIAEFVEKLDEIYLLDNDHFRQKVNLLYETFNRQVDRDPAHAGKCYPQDSDRFSHFIEEVETNLPPWPLDFRAEDIAGMLAPHIDIMIAKHTYINLYRHLRGHQYDLVIIFGINHEWQDGLYSITEKNFITPFGKLETDREFITELRGRVPKGTLATNDYGHRTEHSIEFQTIFLHYYVENPIRIVPILCGGLHDFIHRRQNVFADERFMAMCAAITDLTQKSGKKTLMIAGVDFSHVGLKFGHRMPAETLIDMARTNDTRIISHLSAGKPEKIFEGAIVNQDQFQVCGLPSILIVSKLLQDCTATLLSHETYDEKATRSAVTYASMILTKP